MAPWNANNGQDAQSGPWLNGEGVRLWIAGTMDRNLAGAGHFLYFISLLGTFHFRVRHVIHPLI